MDKGNPLLGDLVPIFEGAGERIRGAGFNEDLSPLLRSFNPLQLLYRAGHLMGTLGLPISYKRTHIIDSRLRFW